MKSSFDLNLRDMNSFMKQFSSELIRDATAIMENTVFLCRETFLAEPFESLRQKIDKVLDEKSSWSEALKSNLLFLALR